MQPTLTQVPPRPHVVPVCGRGRGKRGLGGGRSGQFAREGMQQETEEQSVIGSNPTQCSSCLFENDCLGSCFIFLRVTFHYKMHTHNSVRLDLVWRVKHDREELPWPQAARLQEHTVIHTHIHIHTSATVHYSPSLAQASPPDPPPITSRS